MCVLVVILRLIHLLVPPQRHLSLIFDQIKIS